jgi:hypothetical protein
MGPERDERGTLPYRFRYWNRRWRTLLIRATERLVIGQQGTRVPNRPLAHRPSDAVEVEAIHPRHPDVVVRYGSPPDLPAWLPREAAVGATWTYAVRGTDVDPGTGAVWLSDGTPVPELYGGASRYRGSQDVRGLSRRRSRERLPGTWAVMPNHTYYHFLVEDLPALLVSLAVARDTLGLDPGVLTVRERHRYVSDALATVAAPVHEAAHTPVYVDRLVASGYEAAQVHPSSIAILREHFSVTEEAGDRLLYVSRMGFRRSSTWELDLIHALTGRMPELEVIDGHRMSLREQIATFSQAALVIGPHGAGLTNVVFSPKAARVIEISTPENCDDHFWRLAALRGQAYTSLAVPSDGAVASTAERILAAAGRVV